PGFDLPPLIASQLSHGLIAIAWGMLFGLVFAKKRAATVFFAGLLWGLVVLVAMYYVVLPAFDMSGYVAESGFLYSVAIQLRYGVGGLGRKIRFSLSGRVSPGLGGGGGCGGGEPRRARAARDEPTP